mmetsp:Transcript_55385/g.132302  ORF Transcript_55385/g.132302 Transcript_55385/m.132302 type:complete len:326 (+) Transcript_55385:727-1704(+)
MLFKSLGRLNSWKLWSAEASKVKLCKLPGKDTPCTTWAKVTPKLTLSRLGKATPCKFCLNWSPKLKLRKLSGSVTFCRLLLNLVPKCKACKVTGKDTPSKLWLKSCPNFSVRKFAGRFTPCKLWFHLSPSVKFRKLPGKSSSFKFSLDLRGRVRLSKPSGSITPFKLMAVNPKDKLFNVAGHVTCKLWLKSLPTSRVSKLLGRFVKLWLKSPQLKLKVFRVLGNLTPSKLWLNWLPNERLSKPSGKMIPCTGSLNSLARLKFRKLSGSVSCSKTGAAFSQTKSVIPSKACSASSMSPRCKASHASTSLTPVKVTVTSAAAPMFWS